MIMSFGDDETRKIFELLASRRLPPDIQRTALRKLTMIHAAVLITDLRIPPGNRLEKLQGTDTYSIRINDQWRICFKWNNGNAYSVRITDYH